MSSSKTVIGLFTMAVVITAGCGYVDDPIEFQAMNLPGMRPPPPVVLPGAADSTISNRFNSVSEDSLDGPSAMRWSDKYDELSDKYTLLTENNLALTKERNDLKKRLMVFEAELNDTRQELSDANLFLQDMHKELTQWKGDVLGFRDEMRLADGAQINALTKILKLLGAETSESLAMASGNTKP